MSVLFQGILSKVFCLGCRMDCHEAMIDIEDYSDDDDYWYSDDDEEEEPRRASDPPATTNPATTTATNPTVVATKTPPNSEASTKTGVVDAPVKAEVRKSTTKVTEKKKAF